MFFLSFSPTTDGRETLLAVVRKFQKNVRKHYEVMETRTFQAPSDSNAVLMEIKKSYNDRRFRITKKLFSQDGRPTKRVPSYPKIIYNFTQTGPDPIDQLRREKIAVEGISLYNGTGWEKDPYGRALGNNYRVSEKSLTGAFRKVWAQNRILIAETCREGGVFDELPDIGIMNSPGGVTETWLITAALPVWFRETIRYYRPYRA